MSADLKTVTSTVEDLAPIIPLLGTGKVRELYQVPDEDQLLFVATDRVSAFDVVMKNGIPGKGAMLSRMSRFWFEKLPELLPAGSAVPTHYVSLGLPESVARTIPDEGKRAAIEERYNSRSMVVRKLKMLPVESIVRGYITGSAWAEYQKTGEIHGTKVREGLRESEILEEPMWTPSTKAPVGEKDVNISPAQAAELLGEDIANRVAEISLSVYKAARDYAGTKGIIIADTKFEFGIDESVSPPAIVLVDEVLTPDSSRFWDKEKYEVGRVQDSLDKQVLREWLIRNGLREKKDVYMSDEVIAKTRAGYLEAYQRLTGDETFGASA